MKKTVILIVLGILSLASIGAVLSSSDPGEQEHEGAAGEREYPFRRGAWIEPRADVRAVANDSYTNECGACHFAYQPGLLPQRGWERIMNSLEDHYGDDASLEPALAEAIRRYLLENAADLASQSRSRAFVAGLQDGSALPRITQTNYFRREHYEIPARFVQDNPDVRSFSNCQACHRTAAGGVYNEHQVMIPGVGRWDD
jgi:hypothetical protein